LSRPAPFAASLVNWKPQFLHMKHWAPPLLPFFTLLSLPHFLHLIASTPQS
jgi:hypothetical protein